MEISKDTSSDKIEIINDVNIISAIKNAEEALCRDQHDTGYWCFELEADCTIPSEYILMMHFLDEIDQELQQKLAVYIRRHQNSDGGWPLYYGGKVDLSCTVKAYYALKMAGNEPNASHMKDARKTILSMGGAAKSNVFTRIALAMFEQIPWRGVPFIPVEIMLFPDWFPISLKKVSYWSRTVMVPLFILCSLKVSAINPENVHIKELFVTPPDEEKNYFEVRSFLNRIILLIERICFHLERFIPKSVRKHAIRRATAWFEERLNGLSGLGAIFPAMVNAYEAMHALGYSEKDPKVLTARKALKKLLVVRKEEAYCQPCVSPVWDTLLSICALNEAGYTKSSRQTARGAKWLINKQLTSEPGDWRDNRPDLEGGSWPFQFRNDYYPDLDDTAFAAYALYQLDFDTYKDAVLKAARWLNGMQSSNGGFAAFEIDNTHYHLNEIPFADHGALLDPPTCDVTARCLMLFGLLKKRYPEFKDAIHSCTDYLMEEQKADGSWFGRWGTNYIYGTWSVLTAFETTDISAKDHRIQKAVQWLKRMQRSDGGWGEDNWSYHDMSIRDRGNKSTAFQTAWALMGLIATGETTSQEVRKGVDYLITTQEASGFWSDPEFTAPGFPRVFYLKYHGYNKFFPLWALARYQNEIKKQTLVERKN